MAINSFTHTNLTRTNVTLNWEWNISTLNVDPFVLRRGATDILLTNLNYRGTVLNYIDSDLSPGTDYTYYLFNSDYTFELTITTHNVPGEVNNARISELYAKSCYINWFVPSDSGGVDITGYNILLDNTTIANTDNLYYEFSNLTPATAYTIGIQAVNIYGSGPVTILDLTTKTAPPNPIDSTTIKFSDNILTWSAGYQADVTYLVQRRDQNSYYREVYRNSETSYTETDSLMPDSEYRYRIQAINSAGTSNWSYSAPVVTPASDLINDLILTSELINKGIIITIISDNVPDYYEYRISIDNGISWLLDWSNTEPNASNIVLNGLDLNLIYAIEVRAITEHGTGDTNSLTVNLQQLPPSDPFGLDYSVNLTPAYQLIINWSDQITWNDDSPDLRFYAYELVVNGFNSFGIVDSNTFIYDFNSEQYNNPIEFKVKAVNSNGTLSLNYSETLTLDLPGEPELSVVPVSITATSISFNISTTYNDALFIAEDHNTTLEYKLATSDQWSSPRIVADHYDLVGLQSNTAYNIRFRATNPITSSDYVSFTSTTLDAVALDGVSRLAPLAVTDLNYSYLEVYYIVVTFTGSTNATRYVISVIDNENNIVITDEFKSTRAILRRVNLDFNLHSYRILVRSFNNDLPGGTAEITLSPDSTVPQRPTAVNAAVYNDSNLRLSWTNPTDSDFYACLINFYVNNKESTTSIPVYVAGTSYILDLPNTLESRWSGDIRVVNYKIQASDHFGNISEPIRGTINYSLFTSRLSGITNLKVTTDANSLEYSWDYSKYSRITSVFVEGIADERKELLPSYIPIKSIYFKVGRSGNDYGYKDNNTVYQTQTLNHMSLLGVGGNNLMLYSGSYYGDGSGVLPEVLFDGNFSQTSREIDEISWNIVTNKFSIRTNGNVTWAPRSVLLNYWGLISEGDKVIYQFNFGGLDHEYWINLTDGVSIWSAVIVSLNLNNYLNKELTLHIYRNKPDTKPNKLTKSKVYYTGLEPNTEYTLDIIGYDDDNNSVTTSLSAFTIPRPVGVRREVNCTLQFAPYYDINSNYIYNLSARQLGETAYNITDFNYMTVDTVYEIKCEEINVNGSTSYSYYRLNIDNGLTTIVPGTLANLRFIRTMVCAVTYTWSEQENSNGYLVILTNPDNSETIYELEPDETSITYYPENDKTYSISLQIKDKHDNLSLPYYDDYRIPGSPGILDNITTKTGNKSAITVGWDVPNNSTHHHAFLELYRNNVLILTEHLDTNSTSHTFDHLAAGNYKITIRSLNSIDHYIVTYTEFAVIN